MSEKAREFWIDMDPTENGDRVYENKFGGFPGTSMIHVIEYSAVEKLQAKLELAKMALETYAMTNETFPEYGDVARETLAKLESDESD